MPGTPSRRLLLCAQPGPQTCSTAGCGAPRRRSRSPLLHTLI